MSSGLPNTREQLELLVRTEVQAAWRESKKWPNHPSVDVTFEWNDPEMDLVVHVTPKLPC